MDVIVEGKEKVLTYLENLNRQKGDGEGKSMLMKDDDGKLHLIIDGISFIGEGNLNYNGKLIQIKDGLLVEQT